MSARCGDQNLCNLPHGHEGDHEWSLERDEAFSPPVPGQHKDAAETPEEMADAIVAVLADFVELCNDAEFQAVDRARQYAIDLAASHELLRRRHDELRKALTELAAFVRSEYEAETELTPAGTWEDAIFKARSLLVQADAALAAVSVEQSE